MAGFLPILSNAKKGAGGFGEPLKMTVNPEGLTKSLTGPGKDPSRAVVPGNPAQDAVTKIVGPASVDAINEATRKGPDAGVVQRTDRRGRPIGNPQPTGVGGVRMSASDWNRADGPGGIVKTAASGKTPEEQAAMAKAAQLTEQTRAQQGIASSEFYRNRNPDGSVRSLADRVKGSVNGGSSVGGLPAMVDPRKTVSIASGGNGQSIGKILNDGATQGDLAAAQQATDKQTLATDRTIAVDPKYAGPGQLTTDMKGGAFVRKENPVPGSTAFQTARIANPIPAAPMSNPMGKPLAQLSDASFLGGSAPSLSVNPAETQADKTVNGLNRSDLMNAFKEADAKQRTGSPASVAANPEAVEKSPKKKAEDTFAAPIKLSLS